MIYLFPNLETLRIALASGQIAHEVSREQVEVAFHSDGRVSIKPHSIPPKVMQNALKRLGIKTADAHGDEPVALGSWLQILPITRVAGTPEFTSTTPVLFEMPIERFSSLVAEMLRLGNDRQSFRILGADKESDQRVLLRVIGPPYYTLLRALDRLNPDVAAYIEQAPRVWIEIGHTHPLALQTKVAEGQLLLLRAPREWKTIAGEPFQDIYEILDFRLPTKPVAFAEGRLKGKLTVSLKLAAGNAAEVPEMWVIRDNAFNIFDAFVRDADERLMNRLMFAVAENGDDGPVIVLRTRTSKLTPPAIELTGALGYLPFRRLPNLFLPVGTRLQPTLRRDAIRKMLAEDDAQIVWLTSQGDGRFVPESLPDAAFRPLADWVEYVIDHQRQPLQDWMQATRFDFDDFICRDETEIAPPKPPGSSKPKTRKPGERPDKLEDNEQADGAEAKTKKKAKSKGDVPFVAAQAPAKPDELKIRRTELEKTFLAIEGPLDAPERRELWPQLAQVNAALGDQADAAICWLNFIWEEDEVPAAHAREWLRGEEGAPRKTLKKEEIDHLLKVDAPLKTDLRRLAAMLLFAATNDSAAASVRERLPAIRAYLEKHDSGMPVRSMWLVWRSLARLSGDVLVMARVRDRLLKRLFDKHLSYGTDVPQFVRFAGTRDNNRSRDLREHMLALHASVDKWLSAQDSLLVFRPEKARTKRDETAQTMGLTHSALGNTRHYCNFIFAAGFARLGEEELCVEAAKSARQGLLASLSGDDKLNKVTHCLIAAFDFRINQILQGDAATSLPSDLLQTLDELDPYLLFPINRLRQRLSILEPFERFDPYSEKKATVQTDLNAQLAALPFVRDAGRLQSDIRKLISSNQKGRDRSDYLKILIKSIRLATRVGEPFARELLDHVLPAMNAVWLQAKNPEPVFTEIELHARLVDAAIPVAAHYGVTDLVEKVIIQFVDSLPPLKDQYLISAINLALGNGLKALRKCGLDELGSVLLRGLSEQFIRERSLESIRQSNPKDWVITLRALVHLAQHWLRFGGQTQALPILEAAKRFLLDNQALDKRPAANLYTPLICAYMMALSEIDDLAFVTTSIREVLEGMDPIPNTTTTSRYFSVFHLEIVENLVLALANDELIHGSTARRYLDDDEYLVRRRIHGEMRKLLAQSGL